ncbi:unnamed protein product [Durusdinium trenchii]|uniref:FCP1 homology domain-containing protein n=1 Tax=Durusdinium trenchii TaxID=1381693 RepID=A0ABP0LYF9_9DINO
MAFTANDASFIPIWLGNLPHDPDQLKEAEKELAVAIAKVSVDLGVLDICPKDVCFRFHTKGSSSSGVGLGFGFAWVPRPVAQNLVQVGQLEYSDGNGSERFASVRESRGHPSRPASAKEEIAVAVVGTFASLEVQLAELISQWQTVFDEANVHLNFRFSEKNGTSEICKLLQGKRHFLRRVPIGVVLWQPQDLCRACLSSANPAKEVFDVINAAKSACSAGHVLMFLQIKECRSCDERQASDILKEGLQNINLCEFINWPALVELYPCATSEPLAAACALIIRHRTAALLSNRLKVFVADCDHTLWEGVVAEDGVQGVKLAAPHVGLQRRLAALQKAGRLICIASRNASATEVLQVFVDRKKECPLQLEQIVAYEVHPGPKPQSLQRLSTLLSLTLDSFVFLDDNCFEVEDVRQSLPDVITVHIPADHAEFDRLVQHCWLLDAFQGTPTKEDQDRTELYRQNAARRAERERHRSLTDFLDSLEVEVVIHEPNQNDAYRYVSRLCQLCAKTNQFNTTQLRLSELEISMWCNNELRSVFAAQVKDKFGDYGLVAGVFCSLEEDSVVVDCLAMSCRVLHRGVELQLLRKVAQLALARDKAKVTVKFRPSSKNALARGFLARLFCWLEGHVWQSPDISSQISWECGEQVFAFPALELSQLSSCALEGFSDASVSDWRREAIDRELHVSSWTNVVDAEDWMLVPTHPQHVTSWSALLKKICDIGPDIPLSSGRNPGKDRRHRWRL